MEIGIPIIFVTIVLVVWYKVIYPRLLNAICKGKDVKNLSMKETMKIFIIHICISIVITIVYAIILIYLINNWRC